MAPQVLRSYDPLSLHGFIYHGLTYAYTPFKKPVKYHFNMIASNYRMKRIDWDQTFSHVCWPFSFAMNSKETNFQRKLHQSN